MNKFINWLYINSYYQIRYCLVLTAEKEERIQVKFSDSDDCAAEYIDQMFPRSFVLLR